MKICFESCRNNRVVAIKVQKRILFNKTVIELVYNALTSFEVIFFFEEGNATLAVVK
jgi:hypothetical protein